MIFNVFAEKMTTLIQNIAVFYPVNDFFPSKKLFKSAQNCDQNTTHCFVGICFFSRTWQSSTFFTHVTSGFNVQKFVDFGQFSSKKQACLKINVIMF
jgi:hypothetical protein